jgi:hypothetical protein
MDFNQILYRKFRLPLTKVYGEGEQPWSPAMGRPPWFVQTIITCGGEFSYKFCCRTISKYILFK